MPFAATWIDLETIILSKSEEDKHHMIAHVESKKMIQMNLFTKQKDSQTSKNKFIVTKSER